MPLNNAETAELARLRASRDSWQSALDAGADGLSSFTVVTPSGTTRTVARRSTREIMEVIGTLNVQINRLVKLGQDRVPDFDEAVRVHTDRNDYLFGYYDRYAD